MVDDDQFRLDKLLNRTEQDLQDIEKKENELHQLIQENEKLKKEMTIVEQRKTSSAGRATERTK